MSETDVGRRRRCRKQQEDRDGGGCKGGAKTLDVMMQTGIQQDTRGGGGRGGGGSGGGREGMGGGRLARKMNIYIRLYFEHTYVPYYFDV